MYCPEAISKYRNGRKTSKFYEASIILIPKDTDPTKKEDYRLYPWWTLGDAKILTQLTDNRIKQ